MSEGVNAGGVPEDNLKQKLVMRVAFAGVLIAVLLAALAFIDYLGQPAEEPVASGPTFSSPVPVPKKEVSQPLKNAEPAAPAAAPEAPKVVEGTAPVPLAAPAAPAAPAADAPPKPVVAPQPVLPPSDAKAQAAPARAATRAQTPAEGTSSQFTSEGDKLLPAESRPQPAAAPAAAPAAPPAPPRLFSGYAVQAGVFADAQRAEELRAKLTLNGIPSTMEARVQVGPFKTREEAESAREKMKALGIDGILLPPKGAKR